MPRRKGQKNRRSRKKQTANAISVSRPKTKTYNFQRSREQLLALEDPDVGATGWLSTFDDAVVKTFTFSLAELPNYSEFTGLFSQYKLNSAAIKMFPSYSQVVSSTGSVASNNMIITVWPNYTGTPLTAAFTKAELNEIQSKRQWMFPLNKPTMIKMPLKQLNSIYNSTINTDYTVVRPRYISTTETATPHYGINVHICKCDGSAFGSDSARLKIFEKIYLTTKQVQ
jgi:hypothetical protein